MGIFDGITNAVSSAFEGTTAKDFLSPLIGAGGSFLGQNSANNANVALMNQANAFNAAQAEQQMVFQERMRKTQYQTAVEDLKAAGLNPMLAYTQGGSGTPMGAAASSVAPPTRLNSIGNAVNSALQSAQVVSQVKQNKLTEAQTLATDAQTDNVQADTANKRDLNPNIRKELDILAGKELLLRAETRVANAKAALDEVIKPKYESEGNYFKDFGYTPYLAKDAASVFKDVGTGIGSAVDAFNAFKYIPRHWKLK